MSATVRGTFEVLDRASRPINSIRDAARGADVEVRKLGANLDNIGTAKQIGLMGAVADKIRAVGGESRDSAVEAEGFAKALKDVPNAVMTKVGLEGKDQARSDLRMWVQSLRDVPNRIRTKVDVDTTEAEAKIARLRIAMAGIPRNLNVGSGGGGGGGGSGGSALAGAAAGAAASGGGGGGFSLAGMALPAAIGIGGPPLIGALAPLIGSLGSGIIGAGAAGLGAVGPAVVGLGSIVAVAKPAMASLGNVSKAYEHLKEVQDQYGASSKQAGTAQLALNAQVKQSSPLLLEAAKMLSGLGEQWSKVSGPAQQSLIGLIVKGLGVVKTLMPEVAHIARISLDAISHALEPVFAGLRGPGFASALRALGDAFAKLSYPVINSLANILHVLANVAIAAAPYVEKMASSFLKVTESWVAGTSRGADLSKAVGGIIGQFKLWGETLYMMGKVIFDFFGAGSSMGKGFTSVILEMFTAWDKWINSTTGQRDLKTFFREGWEALKAFAEVLGPVLKTLGEFVVSAMPVLRDLLHSLKPVLAPLEAALKVVDLLLQGVNKLVEAWKPLSGIISFALGGLAVYFGASKLAAMDGMIGKVGKLALAWMGVGRAEAAAADGAVLGAGGAAAAGTRGIVPVGMGGAGGARAAVRTNVLGEALPVAESGALIMGGATVGTEAVLARRAARAAGTAAAGTADVMETMGLGGLGLRAAAGGAALKGAAGRLGGMLGKAGGTLARFMAPLVLLQNGMELMEGKNPLTSGSLGGSMAKGALTGGAIGSIIPGVGTLLGAGVGAAAAGAGHILSPVRTGFSLGDPESRTLMEHLKGQTSRGELHKAMGTAAKLEVASFEMSPGDRHKVDSYLKQVRAQLHAGIKQQSQESGAQLATENAQAFTMYSKRFGLQHAMSITADNVLAQMHKLGPQGSIALTDNMLSWARQQAANNPKLLHEVHQLEKGIVGSFASMGTKIAIINGEIVVASGAKWQEVAAGLTNPILKAEYIAKGAFSNIAKAAYFELEHMGYSAGAAHQLVTGVVSGQIKGSDLGGKSGVFGTELTNTNAAQNNKVNRRGKAHGGRLAGEGLYDTIPLTMGMAAPGELIVNRHTEARVNDKLARFGTTLGGEVSQESRPHHAPMFQTGGRSRAEHGTGALVAPSATGALSGVLSGVRDVATAMLQQFPGLAVTSTRGGTHASHSLHYLGEAVDLAGSSALMNTAAAWVGKAYGRDLEEGIHNPNLSIKHGANVAPSFWGEPTWGEHANHIHIGVLGGGGAAGAAAGGGNMLLGSLAGGNIHLKRQGLRGGIPGIMAATVHNVIAAGLERKINAKLGAGGGVLGGHGGGGTHAQNEALGRQMMLQAGFPASEWPYLQKLWTQESGWDANSVNKSSGAYGIPQALGHGHPFALGDVRAQIAWGLNYIKGRPDERTPRGAWAHEVAHNWYSLGGRAPSWAGWNQAGGSGRFDRPTMVGVGDGHRAESVKITPEENRAGNSSAGAGGKKVAINFHAGSIVVHGTDHAAAKKFVDHVLGEVAAALEDMGMESEQGVSL